MISKVRQQLCFYWNEKAVCIDFHKLALNPWASTSGLLKKLNLAESIPFQAILVQADARGAPEISFINPEETPLYLLDQKVILTSNQADIENTVNLMSDPSENSSPAGDEGRNQQTIQKLLSENMLQSMREWELNPQERFYSGPYGEMYIPVTLEDALRFRLTHPLSGFIETENEPYPVKTYLTLHKLKPLDFIIEDHKGMYCGTANTLRDLFHYTKERFPQLNHTLLPYTQSELATKSICSFLKPDVFLLLIMVLYRCRIRYHGDGSQREREISDHFSNPHDMLPEQVEIPTMLTFPRPLPCTFICLAQRDKEILGIRIRLDKEWSIKEVVLLCGSNNYDIRRLKDTEAMMINRTLSWGIFSKSILSAREWEVGPGRSVNKAIISQLIKQLYTDCLSFYNALHE